MKASANYQLLSLSLLAGLCICGLVILYARGLTPPELLVGVTGSVLGMLAKEVSEDSALSRAERVVKGSTIELVEQGSSSSG